MKYLIIVLSIVTLLSGCATIKPFDPIVAGPPEEDAKLTPINSKQSGDNIFRILAFDGGGIKGALSSKILDLICQEVPELLGDIDLLAGTSTGGIISLGLANGMTPGQLVSLYKENAEGIFTAFPAWFDGLGSPIHTNVNLKAILEANFPGSPTLGSLQATVLVNSFQLYDPELNMWEPAHFDNFPISTMEHDELVVDVALRTSAAPVFFPSYQGYIDGGVIANNPSVMAFATALDPKFGGTTVDKIRILSIGTGSYPAYITEKDNNWGALEWLDPFSNPAAPLMSILIDGKSELASYQCEIILGDSYLRVNVPLDENYAMDDPKAVDALIAAAEKYPQEHPEEWKAIIEWVRTEFMK